MAFQGKGSRRGTGLGLCAPLVVLALVLAACGAGGQEISIQRPSDREFLRDLAGLVDDVDETQIRETCEALLTDKAIPIVVVTIDRMANYGGAGMRIESFAMLLFNQWEIGVEKLGKEYWNKGILLLVSRDDRLARIELGDGWGREQDALCRQVMDEQIVTRFKRGDFSSGIRYGVEALAKMGRGEELPRAPVSLMRYVLVIGFIGLAIFTAVSLVRRGGSGWAWLMWGVVFSVVGYLLYSSMTRRGGGFSGGSFGGGFSGGGGATGSW